MSLKFSKIVATWLANLEPKKWVVVVEWETRIHTKRTKKLKVDVDFVIWCLSFINYLKLMNQKKSTKFVLSHMVFLKLFQKDIPH